MVPQSHTELRSLLQASVDTIDGEGRPGTLIDYSPRRGRNKAAPWAIRFERHDGTVDRRQFTTKGGAWRYLIEVWGL